MELSRQSFLGADSETVLQRTTVAVVGLGGGGSHIVQQLAHLGVGGFCVIDPQVLEETNLNRLIGGRFDDIQVQTRKVDIATRVITDIRPRAQVTSAATAWQESGHLLRHVDVIFGCVDSFSERSQLERAARRFLIPYIDIGMDVHLQGREFHVSGQIAVSIPGGPCLWCMGILNQETLTAEASRYGAAGVRQQVVWTNGVLASTAVGAFVQLFTPWAETLGSPLLEYDGNRGTVVSSSKLAFMPVHCKHFVDIDDLGDPFWSMNAVKEWP